MKVKGLDGRIHVWTFVGNLPSTNESGPHLLARELLHKEFPNDRVLEEVNIPSTDMRLDFYIPLRKLAIEVQGEQHFHYVGHFHKTPLEFAKAKVRDDQKKQFCRENHIRLVEFIYNEDIIEWRNKLWR